MAQLKTYVAIQNFSIPVGEQIIQVRKGEELQFDGTIVIVGDDKISNRFLQSAIGEWIVEKGKYKGEINVNKLAIPSRNATGGRIVENNDPSYDAVSRTGSRKSDDLSVLLKEYDKEGKTIIEDSEKDILKANKDRKKYEVYEDMEVKKVKNNVENKEIKNNKKETLGNEKNKIAKENVVVKENASKKNVVKEEPKKLKVDKEASGKIVKETNFKENKIKEEEKDDKKEIIATEIGIKKIIKDTEENKVVNSSTVSNITPAKKKEVIIEDPMEGAVVVSKVSKDLEERELMDKDGIVSRLKVSNGGNNDSILLEEDVMIEKSNDDIDLSDLLD